MAEKEDKKAEKGAAPRVSVNGQYVKDLSFENPKGAQSFMTARKQQPKVDVNVDLKAATLNKEKGLYEVTMVIGAKAIVGEEAVFVAELSYGAAFTLQNIPEKDMEPTLLIYCPSLMFPFARRIIADAVHDGGFPPLLLDPIDFASLYTARKKKQAEQKKA